MIAAARGSAKTCRRRPAVSRAPDPPAGQLNGRLLTFCETWPLPLPLVVHTEYSSSTCTSTKETTVARTRTTPTFSAAKYVDYIRDLVDATQAGTESSREFIERHARALGG